MIHSFPYTPDCLALSTWVSAEGGDAEALSMLAAEAQGKQQQAAAQAQAQLGQGAAAVAAGGPSAALPPAATSMPAPAAMFALPDQSGEPGAAADAVGASAGRW
jgi:hypothetical protein